MKALQRTPIHEPQYGPAPAVEQQNPQSNSDRILQINAQRSQSEEEETEAANLQSEALAHEQSDAETDEPTEPPAAPQTQEADPNNSENPPEDNGAEDASPAETPADDTPADNTAEDTGETNASESSEAVPQNAQSAASRTAPALGGAEAAPSIQTTSPTLIRPVVNTAMPASNPLIGNIWQHTMGSSPFHQQFNAQTQLDSLYQFASLTQAELNMEAGNLSAQIDVAINARVSAINASIDSAIGQVRGQFSSAKESATADVAGVRAQISSASDGAIAQVTSSEQQNKATLMSGFGEAQNNVDPINSSLVQALDAAWSQRVQEIKDAGEAQAQAVLRKRDSLQGGWQGGDGIVKDKNDARRKTASDVAAKYAAEIREKASLAAAELDGGRSQIASLVQDLLSPISGELASQQDQSESGIVNMAEQARQGIESQRSTALSNVDSLEQNSLSTYQSQEEEAVQQLESTRKACIDSLRAAGETMKANIQNAASGFGQQYSAMMEQLQLVLSDGGDVPPEDEMDEASDRMYADLEEMQATQKQAMRDAFAGGMQDLDRIVNSAQSQIQLAVQQILTGLQTVSNDINSESQNLSAEYTKSTMDMSTQLGQNMNDAANQASESAGQSILDTAALATDPESELMQNLDASKNNVIAQLENSAKSAGTEMKSSADSAAAKVKEKPWYKKVWDAVASVASVIATIVVGIVVFVAIAAFCVATFGTGAIALIAAGAIAGAIASVASKFAGEATHSLLTFSNKFSDFKSYARSFFVGGASGALAMGMGLAAPVLGGGLRLTLSSFGGALFDQLGDIVFLGENWHWGEFLFTGAFAIGLGKLGEKLGKSKLSNWTVGKLFPKGGIGSSWNRFQRFASNTPILKNLNNTERGALWTRVVKSKVGGGPYSFLNSLFVSPIKSGVKEDLVGKNPGQDPDNETTQEEAQSESLPSVEMDANMDSFIP